VDLKSLQHDLYWFARKQRRRMIFLPIKYFRDYSFIHINKTGGTSIERALGMPVFHKPAVEYRRDIGLERWNRRFSFAIVRNPWDRTVSQFHYRRQINWDGLGEDPVTFKEWAREVFVNRSDRYVDEDMLFLTQKDWISDEHGEVIVDYVGQFENLQQAWDDICDRLGRERSTLPHVKKSSRTDFRDYYDSETRKIVGDYFSADIELFGYTFDQC